jgi:Domain of unknown function (DUF4412)
LIKVAATTSTDSMKPAGLSILVLALSINFARGDLTLVQTVEGSGVPSGSQITIKMKEGKTRIETGPQASVIIDAKTGDTITLMHPQKQMMRIPGDKMRAIAEMTNKFATDKGVNEKPKLTPTGKKEVINGMQTDIYASEGPTSKTTYWIATNYPNASQILKEMQTMQSSQWTIQQTGMPDFRDFPGLPLKITVNSGGKEITSNLISLKQDAIADTEFSLPADYSEIKMPTILSGGKKAPGDEQGASKTPTLPQLRPSASPTP